MSISLVYIRKTTCITKTELLLTFATKASKSFPSIIAGLAA